MAEIQSADQSNGQLTQRFIEFVMMQAQQAALCLGKIPHPETGNTSLHLEAAKMFIDHLELLREKTRGNLSQEETEILNGIISELQITFVEVSNNLSSHSTEAANGVVAPVLGASSTSCTLNSSAPSAPCPSSASANAKAGSQSDNESSVAPVASEEESKKKFSKSYGA